MTGHAGSTASASWCAAVGGFTSLPEMSTEACLHAGYLFGDDAIQSYSAEADPLRLKLLGSEFTYRPGLTLSGRCEHDLEES